MNYGIAVLTFLFLSSLTATVMAASSVNININNSLNSSSKATTSTSSQVSSSNNATVNNHIEVEVNGEKRVIDDNKQGENVNSNIKVEAKSENGKTTFNVSGDPQSVKSETTSPNPSSQNDTDDTKFETSNSATVSADKDVEVKKENLFDKIVSFFRGLFAGFKLFS